MRAADRRAVPREWSRADAVDRRAQAIKRGTVADNSLVLWTHPSAASKSFSAPAKSCSVRRARARETSRPRPLPLPVPCSGHPRPFCVLPFLEIACQLPDDFQIFRMFGQIAFQHCDGFILLLVADEKDGGEDTARTAFGACVQSRTVLSAISKSPTESQSSANLSRSAASPASCQGCDESIRFAHRYPRPSPPARALHATESNRRRDAAERQEDGEKEGRKPDDPSSLIRSAGNIFQLRRSGASPIWIRFLTVAGFVNPSHTEDTNFNGANIHPDLLHRPAAREVENLVRARGYLFRKFCVLCQGFAERRNHLLEFRLPGCRAISP